MSQISGYNIPLHQEVISDFIYHIRRHIQSRGLQYEFKVAPEVVLKNEDLKDGYIIPDISVKLRDSTWNQPEMIIEVTRDRSWNSDIKKLSCVPIDLNELGYVHIKVFNLLGFVLSLQFVVIFGTLLSTIFILLSGLYCV